jgi:hypothetical protein
MTTWPFCLVLEEFLPGNTCTMGAKEAKKQQTNQKETKEHHRSLKTGYLLVIIRLCRQVKGRKRIEQNKAAQSLA